MTDRTLKEHVKTCGALKAQIDALTKEYNGQKDIITAELKERKTGDYTACGYSVKYTEYERKAFDGKAFKAKHEDLYNQFMKTTTSSRFSVASIAI